MFREYLDTVKKTLDDTVLRQEGKLSRAARLLSDTLVGDGLIYIFGCGHSHIMAEEGFFRAGGLARVCPILTSELMLHEGAVKSSSLERMEELAADIFARYPIAESDTFLVFSTSGVNGLPVEMARLAQEAGARVIAVSSGAYQKDASRHSSGKRLSDFCDVWLDNCAPHGDATMAIKGRDGKMGPVSTISGCFILNALLLEASYLAAAEGHPPEVYVSGNVEGGRERNQALIDRYQDRIRHL